MSALSHLFHQDIDLKDWESLLAELSVESEGTISKKVESEAWDALRQYSHEDMPHAGNIYAEILLANIEKELNKISGSNLDINYSVNALDTSLSINGCEIADMDDLDNCLNDITGYDAFLDMLDEIDSALDSDRSPLTKNLYDNGSDAVIREYMPENAEVILLGDHLDGDTIIPQLNRALGAAYFIKELILELMPEAKVDVRVVNLEASVNLHVDNQDINVRTLESFEPYIKDQSIIF